MRQMRRDRSHPRPLARRGSGTARAGLSLWGAALLLTAAAAPGGAASLIGTTTVSGAMYSASHYYSHFASGHYWVAFNDGSQPVLYSSPDAVTWTSQGAIFAFSATDDSNRWAVRYRAGQIIALGFNSGDNTRYYRHGTLNAAGTVSWSAAAAAAGPADATDPDLNALVANGRPLMWRAGTNGNGAFWRGSALTSPTWAALPGVVPAYGLSSGFSAGAVLQTGGADPDDLVVLRAFTQNVYAAGNHRLLALKWNDALGAYDGSWYNVSTVGGTLTEDTTTEVRTGDDLDVQRKFAAVADTSGNIHALYVNRSTRVAHYTKAVGFNNAWSRLSSDVLAGGGAAKIAVSAAANGNLLLFYEKNTAQRDIWYRRFDGTSWGPETLIHAGGAIDLRQALAPLEQAVGCSAGVAFTSGSVSPFNVNFTLAGDCHGLVTSAAGTKITVETSEVSMVFEGGGSGGGGLGEFYGKSEPNSGVSRSGDTDSYNVFTMQINDADTGSSWHFEGHDAVGGNRAGNVEVLEVTRARVRLRQAYDFTPTLHLARDWTVQGYPRLAVDDTLVVDTTQDVRGAQGLHPRGAACGGTFYCAGISDEANRIWVATDDAATYSDMLGIAYTTPFFGRAGAGYSWNNNLEGGTPSTWLARVHEGTQVSTAAGSHTRFYLVYPHIAGLTSAGSEWQPYAADYRTPSSITMLAGDRWLHASENTGGGDDFNEAEAAYPLTLHPTDGLRFGFAGTVPNPRPQPFFKVRQWRSLMTTPSVTLDGVLLTPDLDYIAAVKPVSRSHFADDLLWHSTLQDAAAAETPDVGTGAVVTGASAAAGRFGQGLLFDAVGELVDVISSGDIDVNRGAVEFWYEPAYDHADGLAHRLWGYRVDADHQLVFRKLQAAQGESLSFELWNGPTAATDHTTVRIAPGTFSFRAGEWVHLRVTWDKDAPLGQEARIFVNGVELAHTDLANDWNPLPASWPDGGTLRLGADSNGTSSANGVIDEFHLYSSPVAPGPTGTPDPSGRSGLAHAGLTSDAREFLADSSRNFGFGFGPVDGAATRRGEYSYFGADSTFRGLNVVLATAGTWATPGDLVWEFWNGAQWATLESGLNFADTTNHLTCNGNVSWIGDPPGWSPYSVNGGPELYYVRAHLAPGGAYSVSPVEHRITTDILLFQYCGQITATQEFAFAVPPTTAVELMGFRASALDSAAELQWRTASELRNLGFHVYRGASANGPWTRLTTTLIPGLGSSAVGQAYALRDSGLQNGTRYFYRLEDVDASSKTTSHGPVSAVPTAGASAGDDGAVGGSTGASGQKKGPAASGCPDWVLASYGSTAGAGTGSLRCTRHGDPEAVSLSTLSRDSRSATLELRTGGFYALHTLSGAGEASGTVRVFVPGFDFPQDQEAAALPIRRALADAVVGRKVQLGGVRALELESFRGLVPAALGKAEMEVDRDGTVRAGRAARRAQPRGVSRFAKSELVTLLPSLFQGEKKSAVVEIAPLRFDSQRAQLVLAKRVRVRLLFTGREAGESGRGSLGRAPRARKADVTGAVLARLFTTGRGLHAVGFDPLFPGQRRGVAVSGLRLERQGEPVAFHVEPATSSFGPGSRLYFYAERSAGSTDFSSEVAYELVSSGAGVRMALASAAPGSNGVVTPSLVTRWFETNRFYQPGLLEAEDLWLWEALASGSTRAKGLPLSGPTGSGTATLEVQLQGASESGLPVDHHVSASLNGVLVGEAQFAGKRPFRMNLSLQASLLREGENELQLTNVADTGVSSLVFLDRVRLTHPQSASLTGGLFEGTWGESGTATVSGLTGPVALLDVTGAGAAARWLTGFEATAGSLRFRSEAGRSYLAVAPEAVLAPRVAAPEPSTLRAASNQADYILVAPRAFLAAAEPLVERRQDQGLSTRAVAFEEIAAEFGHGQPSAEAIKGFLSHAFHSWSRPSPLYVLLLGDASYDPRSFIGTSQPSPLPALWAKTSFLWTVSDPELAAVNGEDSLPDLAIGRLPATTVEQAEALVQKLLAWEDSGQGFSGQAALVADNPDVAGDFEADVEDIRGSFLASRETRVLKLRELGAATRPAILDALNSGLSYLSYVGHGGAAVWASENVWNSWDAASLQAQSLQPLLLTMNCLNGYFVAPAFESLSESLLKAEGRGAIASFSPSGLSVDGPAHQYHRALMLELTSGRHERLGDAVVAAQQAYAESGLMPELLSVYHLLGDPATPIR